MAEQRLIDANALPRKEVQIKTKSMLDGRRNIYPKVNIVTAYSIDRAPTIDAVPVVHARWIEHVHVDEFGDYCYIDQECSHCHVTELFVDDGVRAFCPNCGAKMDGGVDT